MNPTSNDSHSAFSEACGVGTLRLSVLNDTGSVVRQRTFDPPFLVVGRSPDADLYLDREGMSARHCYLQVIGGRLVSLDLGGEGGVLVDGVAQRVGWITPSTSLQIGPVGFQLQGEAGGESAGEAGGSVRLHPLSSQYARTLPPAVLEIEGVIDQTYGWRMSRSLALIGRSTACQVRLMNPSISNFHAALIRTPTGVWIVDLLSREGVELDGRFVRAGRLEEGVACRLGSFTLRFCRGTLAPAPPHRSELARLSPAPAAPSLQRLNSAERSVLLATPASGDGSLSLAPSRGPSPLGGDTPLRPTWNPMEPTIDPTQQAMMMLAQTLGAMHRDHMNLVKDELAEIRRLADEMHALRAEIGQRPAAAPDPTPAPALVARERAPKPAKGPVAESPTARPSPRPAPGLDATPPMGMAGSQAMPDAEIPSMPRDPKECLAIASQFLASYERKQEGHWSRILRILTGAPRTQEPGRGPLEQAPLG